MWSDERVAQLRKLWAEGLSASQIAKELGAVTRNAVIGKVHRLGLAGRATPSRPAKRPVRAPPRSLSLSRHLQPSSHEAQVEAQVHFAEAVARSQDLRPLTMANGRFLDVLGLSDEFCRFPVGEPRAADFGFCGRGVDCGPYCVEHARLCYQPSSTRRSVDRRVAHGLEGAELLRSQLRRRERMEAA